MRALAAAALLALVTGCSGSPGAAVIDLDLHEFAIDASSRQYAPGSVTLRATNSGEFAHTVVVTTPTGEVVAATDLIPPGDSIELAVDLGGGEYQISCRIVTAGDDGTLFDHFEQGMRAKIAAA